MIKIKSTIKNRVSVYKSLFIFAAVCCSLLAQLSVQAQTLVTGPVTGTVTSGEYYNYSSITISPNASITPGAGQTVHYYVLSPDCVQLASGFSSGQNYILTSTPRVAGITTPVQLLNRNACDLAQTVQYFDGLGRPVQTVIVNGSPAGNDIVQPITYDDFGRQAVKYLPYPLTTGSGSYQTNAFANQQSFYNPAGTGSTVTQLPGGIAHIPSPYAQTIFEASPLNRVTAQGASGDPWQPYSVNGHMVQAIYTVNNNIAFSTANYLGSRQAAYYTATINSDGTHTLNNNGMYAANELMVTIAKDENWVTANGSLGTTETYTDKEDHIVLKRTYNLNASSTIEMLSTYYVYDDFGELAFVLPPKTGADAATTITQTTLDNLAYQYRYDERNRQTQKKIPGKGWEYTVYNSLDQPVLTQDAVQNAANQWVATKYDARGRVIVTGLWNAGSSISLPTLQSSVYAASQWDTRDNTNNVTLNPSGYVVASYPQLSKLLTVNYYDDYSFTGQPGGFTAPVGASVLTKGMLTAARTTVLNTIGNTTPDMLWSADYYDDLGRATQSYKQHYLGGILSPYNYDAVNNTYDFINEITETSRQHYGKNTGNTAANLNAVIANSYVFDHVGRKKQTFESINGGTNVLLSQNDYNEIGQITTKHLHSTNYGISFLQNTVYAYNERGWLSKINDPSVTPTTTQLFSEQLNYNLPQYGATAQFNGNIAEEDYNAGISARQHVTYSYDAVNRLTAGTSTAGFSETGITYDVNGNILTLTRNNYGTLTYSGYTGNQLTTISGFKAGSYTYDVNGNMATDGPRGATITYNMLNLPQTVTASGVNLTFTYDAAGNKLRKVSAGSPIDYISGIQYKTDAATIDFITTEEGRAVNTGSSYNYEYTLTDHLGNNRITFDMTNGKVGEDDYYPFGLNVHRLPNAGNNYLYNKKELQNELTEYDYGARFYDPVIARWNTIDPLAEISRRWSPYNYGENNPVRNIDPDGMWNFDTIGYTTNDPGEIAALLQKAKQQQKRLQKGEHKKKIKLPPSRITAKADALAYSSNIPKIQPKIGGTQPPPFNPDNQATISAPHQEVNYNDFGLPTTSLAIGTNVLNTYGAVAGAFELKALFTGGKMAEGGLNLYKMGSLESLTTKGWKTGDYFLFLQDMGSPELNWAQNSEVLLNEMGKGQPIFDTFVESSGALKPTGGFLGRERALLQSNNWTFNKGMMAWMPPK